MNNISPEQHGRKQRKGQMDAAGLKMLRWLSVTGNGLPTLQWGRNVGGF